MRDAHQIAEPCGSTEIAATGELAFGIVAVVEDVGGDGGQVDRDGALADAALLIENDMNSHEGLPYASPALMRGTSDETAASLRVKIVFGSATRAGVLPLPHRRFAGAC